MSAGYRLYTSRYPACFLCHSNLCCRKAHSPCRESHQAVSLCRQSGSANAHIIILSYLSAFFYYNSVRRMRSRIMKLCVLGGLGDFPQQAFGAMWIATSIASRFLYRFSVPSCLSSLPIRKSSRTIHAGFLQICGYSYIIYFALLCRLER